jgi:23S rRNA (pseudouridine1915-N3)-methyltransferase
MIVNILAVGKLKAELQSALKAYEKRLSGHCKLTITELPEAFLPENPSVSEISRALDIEGAAILKKCSGTVIALCVEGQSLTSEEFAEMIRAENVKNGQYTFIIGSSHGLSDSVKKAAGVRLSFSKMTFPHGLMRVFLLEQIYRACMINRGSKYHK